MRERLGIRAGLAWAAARSLPFVGALAMLYALVVVGLVPRPPFPFDPGLYSPGARAAVTLGAGPPRRRGAASPCCASGAGARRRAAGRRRPRSARSRAAGCLALWLANPYLALLLAPAAHVWLLDGRDAASGGPRACGRSSRLTTFVPALAAVAAVATALEPRRRRAVDARR